ncbi:MAG: lipid-A-disaccharide synthase [bacterium]|nr:lipid-A-disaccharide synthase [bacterium]
MIHRIFIIAGEESGDLHASNLCYALKKLEPTVQIFGFGGNRMQEAGVILIHNLVDRAVVGFWEPIKQLGYFKKLFDEIEQLIIKQKPVVIILVDYPGFNLRVTARIKKYGIPIIYYISPQIWAWGKKRIEKIAKLVDKMLVIFPFEKELYTPYGLATEFVGHPLLDVVKLRLSREEVYQKYRLNAAQPIMTLLPGSREQEIKSLLPIMLSAIKHIRQKINTIQVVLLLISEKYQELVHTMISASGESIIISTEDKYELREVSNISLVSSGTATLEGAIIGTPMVVVYKVSPITAFIARRLITISDIALVNIVAGKRIVPELVQKQLTPMALADEAINLLLTPERLAEMKLQLAEVRNKLGSPGASIRAAQSILNYLKLSGTFQHASVSTSDTHEY